MKFDITIKYLLYEINYLKQGFTRVPIIVDISKSEAKRRIKEFEKAIKILDKEK